MNGDRAVERAAAWLEAQAGELSRRDGWRRRLAAELEEDAEFLRQLGPSRVRARLREPPPADGRGAAREPRTVTREHPAAASGPAASGKAGGGKRTLAILGASLAAGILLAKLLDRLARPAA